MSNKTKSKKTKKQEQLFLLTQEAIPEVLLSVLKVKDLIHNKNLTVANATKKIGISRTTYYKYCDEVFYYDSTPPKKEITLEIITLDKIGVLSKLTNIISKNNFNILTINQAPPIDKYNKISISIVTANAKCNLTHLVDELKNDKDLKEVKIKSINKE